MSSNTDGFVRIPNWIIDDSTMDLHELAVYIVLLRFRDPKTGTCFPGLSTIADRARISRDSVIRTIKKLEERGIIQVSRRSKLTENKPNVYTIAVAKETPTHLWERSARGKRIPKRSTPSRSEQLPAEVGAVPSRSEQLPSRSEQLPPVAPSNPKKIQKNKIHEQALRPAQQREPDDAFTFEEPALATDKQITLLRDLAIIVTHQIPNDMQTARWRKLTRTDAHTQIRGYLKNTGVGGMWTGPQEGTPLWNELSPLTQAWYLAGALPGGLEGAA